MGRRRKSELRDTVEVLALLPWWAALIAAVVSYAVLHGLAKPPVVQPGVDGVKQVGPVMVHAVIAAFATFGQYLVPALCVIAAALSMFKRRQGRELAGRVASAPSAAALDAMSWQDFERLVGEAFRQRGYSVVETGRGGADGGVDLVLRKGNEKFLVQCKQWKALKVGVEVVRELFGVMAARGATGGFVVTSGTFSGDATDFARGRNVELIDGVALHRMLRAAGAPSAAPRVAASAGRDVESGTPACPVCGSRMVRRTAKKGANAGNAFWGCERYPGCRGTRPA
jgi:restriction system protein